MIFHSTPSSITWQLDAVHRITFSGEWTLEPKFYLSVPEVVYWDDHTPKRPLTKQELQSALRSLQEDAQSKGWDLILEDRLSD